MSAKTRARRAERDEVRLATLQRAGWRCELAAVVPEVACWHPGGPGVLDVDERVPRGRLPGAQYDLSLTQAVCRAHHDWLDQAGNRERAEAAGVRAAAWDADRVRR